MDHQDFTTVNIGNPNLKKKREEKKTIQKKDEKKKVIPFRRVREKPRISDSPTIANVVSKFPYLLKKINNFFDISGNKIDNK